jgi:two-component system phosphate regulon sensor histidine kinase PhoR
MLDANRQVVRDNAAARELLGPSLAGRDLAAVLRNPAILEAVDAVLEGEEAIVDVEFSFQVPVERHFSARIARISDTDQQPVAVVIALHDLTVLKRAEEMRSDFVANASHELRTPISVLLGCIQTLRGSARDDPEAQAEFIGLMEGQAERMARLVDDLLSLSRIEMNEHAVPTRPVSLRQIAAQVVNDLQIKAEAQGIRIETEFSADLPDVPGDKDDLYRALQNLVDNALKYAAEDSTVTISARPASEDQLSQLSRNARYVAVSVKDRGEGIAPQHLPRLTERFYRVDTARSRQLGGTGLGLAIVKHVVNRHRGVLLIYSVLGEGSTFTIVLPSLAESAAAKPVQLPPPRPDANAPESA